MDSQQLELARYLQAKRRELRISQDVIAEAMGVSRYTIINLESGTVSPTFMNVWRYLKILEIKLDQVDQLLDSDYCDKLRDKAAALVRKERLEKIARMKEKSKTKVKKKWNKSYKKARKPYRKSTEKEVETCEK